MGGEVTVYSSLEGAGLGAGGTEDISSMDMPGMLGKPGISMPRMGGMPIDREGISMPPPRLPKSLDIMLEELEVEEEKDDFMEEPMFILPMFMLPMFMLPIFMLPMPIPPMFMPPIILLIMSSMPSEGICMPPIMPCMGGMAPPLDIMVEEEEEEEEDWKLDTVEPSSDWVVAAMLWLEAFSSFFTAVPSSVTKAWDWAFIASLTWGGEGDYQNPNI